MSRTSGRGRLGWIAPFALVVGIAAALTAAQGAVGGARSTTARVAADGELLVGFRAGASATQRKGALATVNARSKRKFAGIDAELVAVPGEPKAAIARLERNPHVRFAEPNSLLFAETHGSTPDDPSFHSLWGLDNFGQTVGFVPGTADADIDAREAWEVSTGNPAVVVAVVDSGVDVAHPDLAANIWRNPGEDCAGCHSDGIDNDGNGYVDDWRGWDFQNGDNDPSDDNGHGTHVAGTVGAVGNNGVGVAGVNWSVSLMPLRFIGADGSGTTADAISAVLYAARNGATVINNSYGGDSFSQAFEDAVALADERGALFVVAAGNSGQNNDAVLSYPASYDLPNVVSVAATTSADTRAIYSNYGRTSVDLGAPGDNILSTWPGATYRFSSGTSMAAPHVSGAAALVKAAFPAATGVGIEALLLRTVDAKASLATLVATGGRLNANTAVRCSDAPQAIVLSPRPGFLAEVGEPVTVTAIGTRCGDPAGATAAATWNGDPMSLNGRGDGLYTGTYTPTSTGPITISFSASAGGSTETQTVRGSVPIPIEIGGPPVTATISDPANNLLFAFSGTAGGRISLEVKPTCCSLRVSINRPDGTSLVSPTYVGTSGGFIDTKTLPQTGDYTILLDPQGTATGSVTLKLYGVPSDVIGTISAGGPAVTLTMTTPGQNGSLGFGDSAGQRVFVQVSGSSIPSCTRLALQRPDGSTQASAMVCSATGYLDTQTLQTSGSHALVVDPNGASTGSLTLTLYGVPADVAGAISAGGPAVTLTTSTPGQNGSLGFGGSAGQRVFVQVSGNSIPSCTRVALQRPDGTTQASTMVCSATGFLDTQTLQTSGSYALVVDPNGASTGSLTLTLYGVPPDVGGTISAGGPAVTLTTTPGQNASLTFAGNAGQAVTLKVTSGCCTTKVSILKPDSTTLASTFVGASGTIGPKTLPASGTYTIVVDPQAAAAVTVTLTLT